MNVLKKCILSSFILVFFFTIIPAVHAAEGQMYLVDVDTIELRDAPKSNANVIGNLIEGDKLTTFEEHDGWVKTFFRGEAAWVLEKNLQAIYLNGEGELTSEKSSQSYKAITFEGGLINLPSETTKIDSPILKSASMEITRKQENNLSGYHFIVDAGHGGKDGGAMAKKMKEKDLTLSTAKLLAEELKEEGAAVTLSRKDDTYISLDNRTIISNTSDADAFISIHYNANKNPKAAGISTFYHSSKHSKLANKIQNALVITTSMNDRGTKQANYKVLRSNRKPAVLLELGFITNPDELDKIKSIIYQKDAAEGVVEGIKKYFLEND
ncbi:N-acetylmuramoyl-L-alanine amidase [Virgibacillus halodenitrificans]|uniref:N-acetylmuramoyl-L-alanine amidase n=1 Tax=Virgibacillus halodenitrificans TaxID=1482 RepID=UPI000760BF41